MKKARPAPGSEINWQALRKRLARAVAATGAALGLTPERARLLLEERARRLAQPLEETRPADTALDLLVFTLSDERYCIETRHVQEVLRISDCTPIPGVSELVVGVVNLRGEILVVFDIRLFFGLAPKSPTELSRIVVCGDARAEFGLMVDAVHDVVGVAADELLAHAVLDGEREASCVRGVMRGTMIVLDGPALLSDRRLFVDQLRGETTKRMERGA